MDNVILNLVEQIKSLTARAIEAENLVDSLEEDLKRATESLKTANAAICDRDNTICNLREEIKSKQNTITFFFNKSEKLEEELRTLKTEEE